MQYSTARSQSEQKIRESRLLADGVGSGVLPHLERHAEVTPVVQLVAAVHAAVRTVPDARGRVNLRGGGAQIDTCQLAD